LEILGVGDLFIGGVGELFIWGVGDGVYSDVIYTTHSRGNYTTLKVNFVDLRVFSHVVATPFIEKSGI